MAPRPSARGLPPPHDIRRLRLVSLGKVAAPLVAVLMIAALVALPLFGPGSLEDSAVDKQLEEGGDLAAGMVRPTFEGLDGRGRPFVLRAQTADFASGDQRFLRLDQPEGDLMLSDGSAVALSAAKGLYDREDRLMRLTGEVTLFHDDGFEVVTDTAWLDISGGRAEGSDPVAGEGPVGRITSEGFRIEEEGARVFFTGQSRLVLYDDEEQRPLP